MGIDLNPISTKDWSNETDFTWIVEPSWKDRNDFFNDKPDNSSGSIIFPLSIE
jgi:hypothetical protein